MCFSSLKGFLAGENKDTVQVCVVFDNEEVGSLTKQGAESTFLSDTLKRINNTMGRDEQDFYKATANSFMISADNAHAVHPNYAQKSDPTNRPYMNEGIVIKFNANQNTLLIQYQQLYLKVYVKKLMYLIKYLRIDQIWQEVQHLEIFQIHKYH